MKKLFILIAAVALMATTACNEKPAKNVSANAELPSRWRSRTDTTSAQRWRVEKAAPTQDGKDHTVAEFDTKEYQVTVEEPCRRHLPRDHEPRTARPTSGMRAKQLAHPEANYLMETDDGCKM